MAKIVIVYHSGFGHTQKVAEHVAAGSGGLMVDVTDLPSDASDAAWDELNEADAIVMGSPTYMGTVSAPFKAFMDASGKVWGTQGWRDKLAAGFTVGGGLSGDKLNTLTTLATFAGQHSMIWVSQGVDPDDSGVNRMGSYLGYMGQAENKPADETPGEADLKTAELFGARIKAAAERWVGEAAHAVGG